ncbi:MAG: hypothetical protein QGG09_08935, partial [Pirellulaceae bacterium]|nr:hypothetical protein [Pirellulaceae bacterium]
VLNGLSLNRQSFRYLESMMTGAYGTIRQSWGLTAPKKSTHFSFTMMIRGKSSIEKMSVPDDPKSTGMVHRWSYNVDEKNGAPKRGHPGCFENGQPLIAAG